MKKSFLLGLAAMLLSWTAWAALVDTNENNSPFIIKGVTGDIVYAGDNTQPTITVRYGEDTEEKQLSGDLYELSYTFKGLNDEESKSVDGVRDVGHYTLTVRGKGIPYSYSPARTIEFDVTPKPVTAKLKLSSTTKEYGTLDETILSALVTGFDGAEQADVLAGDSEEEFADFLNCLEVSRNGTSVGETVGTYQVIAKGKTDTETKKVASNYRYTATTEGQYATLTIAAKQLDVTVQGKTYDGVEVTSFTPVVKGTVSSDNVSVALSYAGDGKVLNAGEYELTAALSGDDKDNYTVGDVTYTIDRAELTINGGQFINNMQKYYGESKQHGDLLAQNLMFYSVTGFVNSETAAIIGLTMQREAGEKVGEYETYPCNNGTKIEEGNYETAFDNYSIKFADNAKNVLYTIKKKLFTAYPTAFTLDVKADMDVTYQGKAFEVDAESVTVTYTTMDNAIAETLDNGKVLQAGVDYTISVTPVEGETAINAGDKFQVTITATENGNYQGSLTYTTTTYEITQATLTITPKEGEEISKTYGDEDPDDFTQFYDFKDFVGEDDAETIGLTMVRQEGEDAGSYFVRLYKDGKQVTSANYGTAFGNYKVEYKVTDSKYKFNITKKPLEYWIASAEKTYDATSTTPNFTIAVDEEELVEGDDLENIFTTEAEIAVKFAEDAEVTEAKNVGKYDLTVTTAPVAKNYELTLSETENTEEQYEIKPRELTIVVNEQLMDFGLSDEDKAERLTTWAGWNGGDGRGTDIQNFTEAEKNNTGLAADRTAIRDMYTLDFSDEVKEAGYASGPYREGIILVWNDNLTDEQNAVLANYGGKDEVDVTYGDLTIGGIGEITLDAIAEDYEYEEEAEESAKTPTVAEVLAQYNGATVEKVVIKNLKNNFVGELVSGDLDTGSYDYEQNQKLIKGRWYTLVLPFDITVAELSRKLGYAIVNVPKISNSNREEVWFQLTMGEVKANTLMAFKVAEDMDWSSDEEKEEGIKDMENGISFKNKTLVAVADPETYEWTSDNAGNKFIGVYNKKTITEANEWFWSAKTGKGTPANLLKDGMVVYPLNGYIDVNMTAGANVRIFMEEEDGTVTEISAVKSEVDEKTAEGWYTIGGVKLNGEPTQKGIYINNGKKIVIK